MSTSTTVVHPLANQAALSQGLRGSVCAALQPSRKALTGQAERIHTEMRADVTLEETLDLIDRVDDPALREKLRSVAAVTPLALTPEAADVADRLFAPQGGGASGAIEPGSA